MGGRRRERHQRLAAMKRLRFIVAIALLPLFGLYVLIVGVLIWISFPLFGEPSDRLLHVVGQPMRLWRIIGNWI